MQIYKFEDGRTRRSKPRSTGLRGPESDPNQGGLTVACLPGFPIAEGVRSFRRDYLSKAYKSAHLGSRSRSRSPPCRQVDRRGGGRSREGAREGGRQGEEEGGEGRGQGAARGASNTKYVTARLRYIFIVTCGIRHSTTRHHSFRVGCQHHSAL